MEEEESWAWLSQHLVERHLMSLIMWIYLYMNNGLSRRGRSLPI
jgi:hypothetical protein